MLFCSRRYNLPDRVTISADAPGGYHGYWAQDLYSINENYGTADDLKSLVDAAHKKASTIHSVSYGPSCVARY
jgi:hypothetical protein